MNTIASTGKDGHWKTYVLFFVIFSLGLAVLPAVEALWQTVASCHREYNLLNPIRRCNSSAPQGEWNYEDLRNALTAKKEELKAAGALTHLSIYFQDLDHGPRFGIGEYDKFQPASLMKLPLMIFFLHAADLEPDILNKKLSYSGNLGIDNNLDAIDESILPDTPYTIRELLTKMIVYSDNRSYMVLLQEMNNLSESIAYKTFHDLDVLQMMLDTQVTYVPVSSYAKLFAILYNTGYLSKKMSQLGLQMLSDATFPEGIVKGVPEGQRVAHKFGFAVVDGETQLHDCGIVYHEKMAYTLCIMTTGPDVLASNAAIIDISRIVYNAISALKFNTVKSASLATYEK